MRRKYYPDEDDFEEEDEGDGEEVHASSDTAKFSIADLLKPGEELKVSFCEVHCV